MSDKDDFDFAGKFFENQKKILFEEEVANKRQQRKLRLMVNITLIYVGVTFLTLGFLKIKDSFFVTDGTWDFQTVTASRIIHLEDKLKEIEMNLALITGSGANSNFELNQIKFSIQNQQSELNDIKATIIGNYDQALTPRLLRDKQANIEADLDSLKIAQTKLNEKFDDFMVRIFTAPLIGAGMTLIIGLITWLYQKLWSSKKENT